jgi:dienelactone hydrolase
MNIQEIKYQVGGHSYTGCLADGSRGKTVPGILVAHEGDGLTEHTKSRALMLAERGYVAFALDIFGTRMQDMQQIIAVTQGLMSDLPVFRERSNAALKLLKSLPNVDASRTAAVGFCFGGTTVLELARSGAEITCVVGFHCMLRTSAPEDAKAIRAKVSIHTGIDDPVVPREARAAFEEEMKAGGVDWQMVVYGGTCHSFTNPNVDGLGMPGFSYNASTTRRSWSATMALFDECFTPA